VVVECTGDCLSINDLRDFYNDTSITKDCEFYTVYSEYAECCNNMIAVNKAIAVSEYYEAPVDDGSTWYETTKKRITFWKNI